MLGKVQYILNNTYHKAIDSTPSKLLFGFDQRYHSDADLQEAIQKLEKIDSDINIQRAKLRDCASEANKRLQLYKKTYYDKRHKKPSQYKEGDLVMIRQGAYPVGTNRKLLPKFKGPFKINKVLAKNRYVITDVPGYQWSTKPYNSILSSDKIKPWIRVSTANEITDNKSGK